MILTDYPSGLTMSSLMNSRFFRSQGNLSRTLLSIEKEAVEYNKTIIVFVSFYLY